MCCLVYVDYVNMCVRVYLCVDRAGMVFQVWYGMVRDCSDCYAWIATDNCHRFIVSSTGVRRVGSREESRYPQIDSTSDESAVSVLSTLLYHHCCLKFASSVSHRGYAFEREEVSEEKRERNGYLRTN